MFSSIVKLSIICFISILVVSISTQDFPRGSGSASTSIGGFGSLSNGLNAYTNPCQPQQTSCPLQCKNGYITGNNGCQFCFCALSNKTATPVYTTPGQLVKLRNPCFASQRLCRVRCKYGYLKGPGNCDYCICAPWNLHFTTATTTPATTTPVTTTTDPIITNPCVAGQTRCTMKCRFGLLHGPDSCEYCLCAPSSMASETTVSSPKPGQTSKPQTSDDVSTVATPTSTVSPDVPNECIIATTICQLKCKGGFIIDAHRCTFCVCKDQVYNQTGIVIADEPVIQLMNPCVEGLNICRIFCAEGYLRGPKHCQYCACRH